MLQIDEFELNDASNESLGKSTSTETHSATEQVICRDTFTESRLIISLKRPCGISKSGSRQKQSRVSRRWGLPWGARGEWCASKNTSAARRFAKARTNSTG